jgi:Zn-dependent M28 family amino/carboxypeptidase
MLDTSRTTQVPFAELPIEAKVLFYFQSMAAWEYHLNWAHTAADVYRDLERIWNAEQLTFQDLRDWPRMSEILVARLSKGIPQERSRNEPGTRAQRRPLR